MKNKKTILGLGIVLFFTIFACLPLFSSGFIPTHDGEYHIIRFIEFFRMIRAGYLIPRWAPTLNSGYGIPIFLFHYPLPNYIGTFMQSIGLSAVESFKISLACGYICAGILSCMWLTSLFGTKAGVVGAIAGAFVPYWFVDLYVRGSVGEVWAIAFVFGVLYFSEHGKNILLAFSIAALMLSHNILAMLFIPFLFGYIFLRNKKLLINILFGILLASYFWIPAIVERTYVVGLNTVNFRDHFAQLYELIIPSWGTELSGQMFGGNKMSFQIGVISICLFIASCILYCTKTKRKMNRIFWYFIVIFIVVICLMQAWTAHFWQMMPFLQYVQYPWRLLSFVIPITAFMGASVSYFMRKRILSVLIIVLSVMFSYSYMRPVIYAPRDDAYYMSRNNFTDGTSSMGNSFSTIWTGWKSKRPEYIIEIINGKILDDVTKNSYLKKVFSLSSETGSQIHIPILYYPGWTVLVDKKKNPIDYQIDGTIRFAIPQGNHHVEVYFSQTPLRTCADMITVITLVWLLGWGIIGIYANRNRHVSP